MARTDQLIDDILRREGGYVNNPADPGGPTNYGITLATLAGQGTFGDLDRDGDVDAEDVKILTVDQARTIYKNLYVEPYHNYQIWPRLQELLVDSAVQHGVARVNGWLGEIANKTSDPTSMHRLLLQRRMKFYGEIITKRPQNAQFAAGWMVRLSEFVL